ncbi:MAG: gamma carbonic anhydrase family protein [Pseudomonadota bacterium]
MAIVLPYQGVWPTIHDTAFIAETAVIIGDVEIGAGSGVWYGCVLRGDVNVIRVGENTNIQDGTVVHVSSTTQGSYIGSNITIGHMALIHACTLEDGCFIGMKACVMDDAKVARGAMVGAGAMVTPRKQVPSGQLWLGSPAKYARGLSEAEQAHLIESPAHYARLAQRFRQEQKHADA